MAVDWSKFSPADGGASQSGATLKPPVDWSAYKPADDTSNHSTLGDLGRSAWGALASGTGELVQGVGDIGQKLDQAQGVNTGSQNVQALGKRIQKYGETEQQNVSPAFAQKTSQSILTRQGFNPTNIVNKAINTVAGTAPALAGTAIASLAGPEVGIPVGASLFGTQGEAAGRNAGEQQVAALTPEQLAKVPRYQALVKSGIDPTAARAQLQNEVADRQALVQGGFGTVLGVAGEIPGVSALGRAVGSKLTRVIGDRAAQVVGKGVGEGVGFGGINAAGQALSNVTNQVPTSPTAGVGEAFASGLLPGAVLGGSRELIRPSAARPTDRASAAASATGAAAPEPFPGAAPGSLSDAANTLHRSGAATPAAPEAAGAGSDNLAQVAPDQRRKAAVQYMNGLLKVADDASQPAPQRIQARADATDVARRIAAGEFNTDTAPSDAAATKQAIQQWPKPDWMDTATGEMRAPTDAEIQAQLHVLQDAGSNLSSKMLGRLWHVDPDRVATLMKQVRSDRNSGMTTQDAFDQAAATLPAYNLQRGAQDQEARLQDMQGSLDQAAQSLADIRTRLAAARGKASDTSGQDGEAQPSLPLEQGTAAGSTEPPQQGSSNQGSQPEKATEAAKPEEPQAESPSSATDAAAAATPPAETKPGEPGAQTTTDLGKSSQADQTAPESAAATAARAQEAPSAPESAQAGQAAKEAQVPSSEPSNRSAGKETTPNVVENQVTGTENSGTSGAGGERSKLVQSQFDANKAAIEQHGFKAGDRVSFDNGSGKTIEGTIAKGDKTNMARDMGVFTVESPGRNGTAKHIVGARKLSKVEPAADQAAPGGAGGAENAPQPAGAQNAPPEGSAVAADSAATAYADEWMKEHGAKNPGFDAHGSEGAKRFGDAVASRDADTLIRMNLGDAAMNKASRRAFQKVTGVQLPRTRGGTEDAIDRWAGVSPEERARRQADKTARRLAKDAEGADQRTEAAARSVSVKDAEGGKMDGKTFIDKAIAQGFDRITKAKRGAIPITRLENGKGQHYPLRRKELQRYAELAVERHSKTVAAAAKESAAHPENPRPEPTPAQHQAGNFKMGHVNLHGLDVTIEVPKGALRRGTDASGKPWERSASDHYGYVRRTAGADGEQVDVYLGPHAEDPKANVFVIDQNKRGTSRFDEHKAMIGYATGREARAAYDANFPKGLKVFGGIRKMSLDEFKGWLKTGDTSKPVKNHKAARAETKTQPAKAVAAEPGSRTQGLPESVKEPVSRFRNDQLLKRDPDYKAAKAGDAEAAARLVKRLAGPMVAEARARFGEGAIYVAPHAEEATGKNAIPRTLAEALAEATHGASSDEMVQTNQVHHTGADIMQRLIARPQFDGEVKRGGRYVLVDDVTTSGGTFADLADYIRSKGGDVVGAASLVNAARGGKLAADAHVVRRLEGRHGDVIRQQFGIEPRALTAGEANYLTGFRSADEIRNRAAKAARERSERLRSKGVQGLESRAESKLTSAGSPLGVKAVQDIVDRTTAKWGDEQPHVRVVKSADELPAAAKRANGFDAGVEGYYDGRTVWLVSDNLHTEARVRQVLAHEAIGHYGVDRVVDAALGAGAWQKIENSFTRLDREGLGSDSMKAVLAEVHRRYPGVDARTFAKEALAVMAEKGIRNGLVDRVVAAIREFLRKVMPGIRLSPAELRQLLARSEKFLREGESYSDRVARTQALAFSDKPDTFYSALSESVAAAKGAPKKADAEAWKQWLDGAQRRGEFKGAERDWIGLDQWLGEQKGPITREDLIDHVRQNAVHVQEVLHAERTDTLPAGWHVEHRPAEAEPYVLVDENGKEVGWGATAEEAVSDAQDPSERAGATKYGEYTLPGGKNYRELLMTLPDDHADSRAELGKRIEELNAKRIGATEAEDQRILDQMQPLVEAMNRGANGFRSGHFDERNILAHVRMNDRTGPNGEKILHVEEVQSDWHQAGRKSGYRRPGEGYKALPDGYKIEPQAPVDGQPRFAVFNALGDRVTSRHPTEEAATAEAIDRLNRESPGMPGVPDAPFKKEWPLLAMKRVLRYAAEHGYDKVTWTTGDQQAERYDLSKTVNKLIYMPKNDGGLLFAYGKDGNQVLRETNVSPEKLSDYVGKEAAQKLIDQPTTAGATGQDVKELGGADLKLGGEGMKAFYDKLLPNELGKYVKKWGAVLGSTKIEVRNIGGERLPSGAFGSRQTVHSVDITPKMREGVMQGQPLFARPDAPELFKPTKEDANRFRDDLRETMASRRTMVKPIRLGDTAPVLRALGAKELPIEISRDAVRKATNGVKHVVPMDAIERLPEELHDPLAVFKSRTHDGSMIVLTEQRDAKGSPVVAALDLRALGDKYQVNRIASVYGKDGKRPLDMWVKDGLLAYKSDRAERSPVLDGLQLPNRMTGDFGQGKVLTEADVESRFGPAKAAETSPEQPQGAFSRPEPADDNNPSDPSKEPRRTVADIEDVLKHGDAAGVQEKARSWLRGKFEDFRPAMLGALQTRHLLELMEEAKPLRGSGKQYARSMQQMAADREQLMAGAPDAADHPDDMLRKGAVNIAESMRRYAYGRGMGALRGRVRPEAQRLFDVMHAATLQRMDPDKAYERLTIENAHGDAVPWTHEEVKARLKLLRELAMQRGGDPWGDREKIRDEVKYLRNIAKMERLRERNWPKLQEQWQALPEEGKQIYREVRDWYSQHRDATEQALIKNIEALDMPETYRQSLVSRMRLRFEEARREGVYFPLNRDGDFWLAFRDRDGNEGFKMFEKAGAFEAGEKKLRAAGFQIDAKGRRDHNVKAKDAPPGTFVRQVIDILQKAHVGEQVQDEVYQSFLRSLPELSMRKHAIHRKNIAGFSEDALRAFSKNGYHGAHQLARLRHAQDMQFALDGMKASLDNWRRGENATDAQKEPGGLEIAKADALLGEMQKRHDWIMHPNDQRLANMVNSLGFIYYLGASPASAITNLTQVAQTVLPVLGAEHGWGKATRMLGAAWRDAARTGGHMDRTLTDPEERRAFMVMQQRGDFSKTQSHTLAGLAEGNVLQTSPAWSRTMNAISWMFHTAEVINREATGMAAYRLARSKGLDFGKAIQYAGDTNANANFDYSAANRSRYMQGNVQRMALQFKSYSIEMTWLFYRNLFQSMKGETPEIRRVARRTVTGLLGMTAILAGATGLPVYNAVKMTANAANTLFGDDNEPWNFDDEFHRWLADNLGADAARLIAEGPTNYLTGANIASRTSMSNLWINQDDQNLEGADAYHALLESLAGPIGGITKNFYVGAQRVRQGNVERGVEMMLPTAVKNSIKALRFAHEGVNSLRGDPIVPDVSAPQDFMQAIGFEPAAVAEQYRVNNAMKNYTTDVLQRRSTLMNAYALAIRSGDPSDRGAAVTAIGKFNSTHPQVAITLQTLRRSLAQRARLSAQARNGVIVNRKLALQAQQYAGAQQ